MSLDKTEKVANIVAFLCILFGEDSEAMACIMEFSPDYIIEKFERYVESQKIEHPWGMHPILRNNRFNGYIDKWDVELRDDYGL